MQKEMMNLIEDASLHDQFKVLVKDCIESKSRKNYIFGELTILHYRIFGGNDKFIYKIAAIVELFIMCYEMFDDLRKKDKTVIPLFDSKVINSEVGLLALCNTWIDTIPMPEKHRHNIMKKMMEHCLHSSKGSHQDIINDVQLEMDYIESVRLKSGRLTALACVIGSLCGTIDEKSLAIIQAYSEKIGMIAQISNDLHNILRTDEKNDLLYMRRCRTLPIYYLSQTHDPQSQEVMSAIDLGPSKVKEKLPQLVEKIKSSGLLEYIKVVNKIHQLIALSYLVELDIGEFDRSLIKEYIC
jgi:competence protein ComQ